MRRVIDGKRYDTETAQEVHAWDNGRYQSDFRYRAKSLFRTAKGAWFIYHEGGAMTDMARTVGDASAAGADIEPVTDRDALAFLESHGGEEAIELVFADQVADA